MRENIPPQTSSHQIILMISPQSQKSKGAVLLGVPIFPYTEVEEATSNFDSQKELGDGGFGAVYYGKLQDGREVAVKRLYDHNYKRKFKLLATQCGVAQSPTRSPRTSPVVHLRRKKTTLRMLLSRSSGSGRRSPPRHERPPIHCQPRIAAPLPEKKRDTLKDLFVSSPSFEDEENKGKVREMIGASVKCLQ
ncbi:hypothetical protein GH714_019048 [Hevea brasiliensis]|uniref:Protein kinase domain-containing protein n=1 Tax=Hevea brasiliensis TaxID=3981 RepID=A0A6A6NDG0_HEVBR|nr:hypothetical protein GH714_019048 [Hevea brasiliensis]